MSSEKHFDAIKQQNIFIETLIMAASLIDVKALVPWRENRSIQQPQQCLQRSNELAKEKANKLRSYLNMTLIKKTKPNRSQLTVNVKTSCRWKQARFGAACKQNSN